MVASTSRDPLPKRAEAYSQAFLCVIIGYSLVGPILVLNARPGAVLGLIFPSVNRTTFGLFGSLWPVFNREYIVSTGRGP